MTRIMATVINFEARALARLQQRVAEVEEANEDLIAFARGHSGTVSSIHAAVLAAMEADGLDHLIHIVTQDWPELLGVDAVALALVAGDKGLRADLSGMQFVDPRLLDRSISDIAAITLRSCGRGHPLFGAAAEMIRTEALVRLDNPAPFPTGLLALGQRTTQSFDTSHGSELLVFLGATLSRMMGRWLLA